MNTAIIVRDCTKADLDFVFQTWIRSYQSLSYFAKRVNRDTFFKHYTTLVNDIVDTPGTVIKVAADTESTIFGYIVASDLDTNPCVHFAYVRPEYQRLTIARQLFESLKISKCETSAWTPVMNEIAGKHRIFTYNPFLLFGMK